MLSTTSGLFEAENGVAGEAGRLWPDPDAEPTRAVLVVTRTTASGLTAAKVLAAQYLAGAAPENTALIGCVAVADQPGRLPSPLGRSLDLLSGVYASTWLIPYLPELRVLSPGEPPPLHPGITEVLSEIRSTITERTNPS